MNSLMEGRMAFLAAFLVLMSAMWDPRISVAVYIILLVALSNYRSIQKI